jgi:NADP-dependent alcohol dehydrogenase
MNSGAVVTIQSTQEKLALEALLCFQNFLSLTTVIPQRQLQNGVVDAYTHVLEQYLTYPHEGHLQDRIAEGILHTLIEVGPKVVEDPTNYELASNFMWSCTMALNGLIQKEFLLIGQHI